MKIYQTLNGSLEETNNFKNLLHTVHCAFPSVNSFLESIIKYKLGWKTARGQSEPVLSKKKSFFRNEPLQIIFHMRINEQKVKKEKKIHETTKKILSASRKFNWIN